MSLELLPSIPGQPRCDKCGATMYKCGESATLVRYRCLSGKHTYSEPKPVARKDNARRNNRPPNDAA